MDVHTATLSIEGMDDLQQALNRLSVYAESDVCKDAAKEAMQPVYSSAQAMAPEETGKLKRAIRIRSGRSSKGRFSVLVSLSSKLFTSDEFYGGFQEFGWKSGKRKKGKYSKDNRRQNPGEHFLQYAAEANERAALDIFVSAAWKGIEAEWGKQ